MRSAVFRHLGAKSDSVVVGPAIGFDNAVINAGDGRVLIVTADPVSLIPAIGARTSAWMSVNLIASDFATSGVRPQFASFTFNLPPDLSDAIAGAYLAGIG